MENPMSELLPPTVAIAIVTVTTPKPPSEGAGTYRFLAGIALFEVAELEPGDYRYRLSARVIPAGSSEAVLADWLSRNLPPGKRAIGWHLADAIVPALMEAAEAAAPKAAGEIVDGLARAITMEAVDLADLFGGMAAPSFQEVCAGAGIRSSAMADEAMLAAWGIGRMGEATGMLVTNAIAAWRLWAEQQRPHDPVPHRFAADALANWRVDAADALSWPETPRARQEEG